MPCASLVSCWRPGNRAAWGASKPSSLLGAHTVIEHVLQPLLQADLAAVAVVLGHRAADIAAVIEQLPVRLLHNPQYQHGMTTSVQVALREIYPVPDAYLLALVDQPHLHLGLIQELLAAFAHTRKGLVIPTYAGKRGHPILHDVSPGSAGAGTDQGLNMVTRGHPDDTLEVPAPSDDILRIWTIRKSTPSCSAGLPNNGRRRT